ncbi:MAG TPA: KH domain-containing protein [Actinomycetota bacterium]|nr:KH domain-containing protein [Actinomycetota bacterium]
MKELLEYIVRHLVEDPDGIEVTEIEDDRGVVLQLRVAPDDMGKVIGRGGRMARAIRSIVRAAASQEDMAAKVEILE